MSREEDFIAWIGPESFTAKEVEVCNCGHKRLSHGSYGKQGFIGLGEGPCGMCGCEQFQRREK